MTIISSTETSSKSQNIPASSSKKISSLHIWRFLLPLGVQLCLIFSVAAPSLRIELTGKTLILKTINADPYDPLRGGSQGLIYYISRQENLRFLPGWKFLPKETSSGNPNDYTLKRGTVCYIVMQRSIKDSNSLPPKVWRPIRVQSNLPTDLPDRQVALRGVAESTGIKYGLETYYMPEELSSEVNREVQEGIRKGITALEIKVDEEGQAIPIKLWLGKKEYKF